jgi:hypothetical protein
MGVMSPSITPFCSLISTFKIFPALKSMSEVPSKAQRQDQGSISRRVVTRFTST